MTGQPTAEEIRDAVRERYAGAARQVHVQKAASCCSGSSCGCGSDASLDQSKLYAVAEIQELPEKAVMASLGCGNPTLLAELKPGETVLDLGSGGGIDVLLSARRVGPSGKAYGLDMTDEMLELARANAREAKVANVEFLKGQIESIPLPDESVDVIISNCVINLSADKDAVLREGYRVLKSGGRFAVADIVVHGGPLPESVQKMMALWAGCIAGALTEEEYRAKLEAAGFEGINLEVLKVYGLEDVPEEMSGCIPPDLSLPDGIRIVSAFISATKGRETSEAEKPPIVKNAGESTARQAPVASGRSRGSAAPECCGSQSVASVQSRGSTCCTPQESAPGSRGLRTEPRKLDIELMYLDLTVCAPCQGTEASLEEAIAEVGRVLQATGIEVTVRKHHIQSEEQAREMGFVSSPTLRINGRDLQLEVRESFCESCSDLAGEAVDCRVWVYQGEEYQVPPKAMIVDAILREVYGGRGSEEATPLRTDVIPENLKKFFVARRERDAEGSPKGGSSGEKAGGCCGSSGSESCCG